MKLKISFPFFLVVILSCGFKTVKEASGIVSIVVGFYNTAATPSFTSKFKIWYNGNLTIQEIIQTDFNTDTSGRQTMKQYVKHYLYINRETRSFYQYSTLSDTATISKSYKQPDSIRVDGGWNFYHPMSIDFIGNPETLTDTIVNDILYSRIKYFRKQGKHEFFSVVYFRCDLPNSMFSIFKPVEQGCPSVKVLDYSNDISALSGFSEIHFLANQLTADEIKIFDAWKKNEKKYPVIK